MVKLCNCLRGQCERNERIRSVFLILIPVMIYGAIWVAIEWQLDIIDWVVAHDPYGWLVVVAAVLGVVLVVALTLWIACHHHPRKPQGTYFGRRESRRVLRPTRPSGASEDRKVQA
jgi:hypothetical protein